MDRNIFHLLMVMSAIFSYGSCFHIKMEALPKDVDELVPESNVTISCFVTNNSSEEILAVEIGKDSERPIATLQKCSDLFFGGGQKPNVHVEGRLERNSTTSFIKVTIKNPTVRNSGTYKCKVIRLDEMSLSEEVTKVDLTITSNNVKGVFEYFWKKFSSFENRIKTAEDVISEQRKTIVELTDQIKIQELKLNKQTSKVKLHAVKINHQDLSLNLLNSTAHHHTAELQKHDEQLKSHQEQIQQESSKLSVNSNRIGFVEDLTRNQSKIVAELNDKENFMVAFTAVYNSVDTFKSGDTIVFRQVLMKEGNGYDENTGIFKAPRPGIYAFHLAIGTPKTRVYYNIDIVANGKKQARLFAYDADLYGDQSAASCTVRLKKDETVKAVVFQTSPGANSFHPEPYYSIFTGYLVREM